MSKTIELDEGKYTIIYDEDDRFPVKCLRHGEEWRDLVGDNLIFWLCAKIDELEKTSAQQSGLEKPAYNYEQFYFSHSNLSSHYK